MLRNCFLLLLLALLSLVSGFDKRVRTIAHNKLVYGQLADLARLYRLPGRFGQSRAELITPLGKLELEKDKKSALFDGTRFYLTNPPLWRGGIWYISELDFESTIRPLWQLSRPPAHPVKVIVLDPGHGGKDVGAVGKLHQEKNLSLRLAQKVKVLLDKVGYKVVLTRTYDTALGLPERAAFANKQDASLFLSLHMNAATPSVRGIESYALTPAGAASTNSTQIEATRYAGNAFDANNMALAFRLQRGMLTRTSAEDRGVKRARFAVLRDIQCPAVLLEVGFISHPDEEKLLGTDAHLDKLALGIAEGILEYHRSVYRKK